MQLTSAITDIDRQIEELKEERKMKTVRSVFL
jgi:hypothetical protein